MKIKLVLQTLVLALAGWLATGCSATLHHGTIYTTPTADKGPMGVLNQVPDFDKSVIGWGSFTLFAIPIWPVTYDGQLNHDMMTEIKDAVQQAGFKPQMVDSAAAAGNMPVFSCKVNKFLFWNYTYLFPVVFNWGTIKLDATVNAPDGKILWQKSYVGKGNGFYAYNPTVNKAMTSILNDLATDLSGEQFNSPPAPAAAPAAPPANQ